MKNLILIFFALNLLSACNLFEDECGVNDFVGTYTLDSSTVDEECISEYATTINVMASGTNAVSVDGGEVLPINGCSAFNEISGPLPGLASGDKLLLDGNSLRHQKNTCIATYNRE